MSTVQRDANGRFLPGTRGGPGRKPRQVEEEYLRSMTEICDSEAWEAITKRAVQDAISGDSKARNWLSGYLLGQPVARTEEPRKTRMDDILARLENLPEDTSTGGWGDVDED